MAKTKSEKDPTAGMSEAKRAYEARRAEKAGMSLEKWLAQKEKAKRAEAAASAAGATPVRTAKRSGVLGRLLGRGKG
ncbi:hypothetical protein [Elioraea thermophila]|uniref:hypothetical protein n=1 Tax=Elioraea thermophila TaxID=2185104 RepID=UPI000DF3BC1D|nr:hypothetical protein [Elioraea thermophila]